VGGVYAPPMPINSLIIRLEPPCLRGSRLRLLVWRFFDRHGIGFKKKLRATKQDRPDVAAARLAWVGDQTKLDPDRLVFIDETTKMGGRAVGLHAANRSAKSRTDPRKPPPFLLFAGLLSTALTAPHVIDRPMNGNAFLAYVEQVLVPTLKPRDVVVLAALTRICEAIDGAGAKLL
jgi:hypothetical protein